MNDEFLSQEEIESLLNGSGATESEAVKETEFSTEERDMVGEIGNITMGSASTALSQTLNQSVNITTPEVSLVSIEELKAGFVTPNLALNIKYTVGLTGENVLVLKTTDAAIIANLMMGGDGTVEEVQLTELEISAVTEAMNQMMGSGATAMSSMLNTKVDISPPTAVIWEENNPELGEASEALDEVVKIEFDLIIGTLIHSKIMQIYPIETAREICKLFMEVMSKDAGSSNKENETKPNEGT